MSVFDWLGETADRVRSDGVDGLRTSAREFRVGVARRAQWLYDSGEPVYERDWDLLVVLDACRFDLFTEVADEYDYVEGYEPYESPASLSARWMRLTFAPEYDDEVARTVYVNGNPGSADNAPDPERFLYLDDVWEYAWDDERGTILPEPLTDRAIALGREYDPDRMIVHYMQPHYPMVPEPFEETDGRTGRNVWDVLREGEADRDEVWRRYRGNLQYVMDRLPQLLNNVDAEEVVITADHGNLLGEWGLYGHFGKVPHPALRRVPWARATATDTAEYEPELTPPDRSTDRAVETKLRDLGYV
ncbi:MAG: hypothetical protein ABEI11_04435 [Haloarculaceae archaeon]|jgi:hypothetical protein